eukprot:scaffold268541_cov73-Cyclotella_meneghiniana.AAC.2
MLPSPSGKPHQAWPPVTLWLSVIFNNTSILDPDYVSDGSDEDWDRDRTTSGEDLDHCMPDCIHYGESANSANESAIPFSMGPLCSKLCNTLLVKKCRIVIFVTETTNFMETIETALSSSEVNMSRMKPNEFVCHQTTNVERWKRAGDTAVDGGAYMLMGLSER